VRRYDLPNPRRPLWHPIPMRAPCDESVIRASRAEASCTEKSRAWVLAATILGSSMAFIDSTVVNVALPAIQSTFHANVVDVQWVVESYGLFLAALILVGGSLGDIFGRRFVFLLGVVIFALASLACGFATNVRYLVLARSIQGTGAALLVPGSLAIISSSFDEKSRGKAIGTWSGFTAITAAIGPVLGGWLVEHASWRWAFFINPPLAAGVLAISLWRVPESRNATSSRIDWLGSVLATLGLGGIVNGFIESVNLGWSHPWVFASLAVGCVSLVGFVLAETRAASPIVPLELFRSRTFSGANLLTLLLYAALGVFLFLFPLNLIQVQGYSPTRSGAAILPMILLMFLLSRWSGGLVARYGARRPLIIGPLVAAAGFALFALPSISKNYWFTFFPAVVVLGFGMAVTVAPLTTVVMNSIEQSRVGAASGINNAVARVAGVLAIAVLGVVMVSVFASRLNRSLSNIALPHDARQQLQAEETKLAGMQVPAAIEPEVKESIHAAINNAFVLGFRTIMLICAVLGIASAAAAGIMVQSDP
jgi:EmrB/QacA subfamily drug resistance transporter